MHCDVAEAEMLEDVIEAGDEDCAAADAEEASGKAGENAEKGEEGCGDDEFHVCLFLSVI